MIYTQIQILHSFLTKIIEDQFQKNFSVEFGLNIITFLNEETIFID